MKPIQQRATARAASAARAKMFLKAHLGWLCGFPEGQEAGGLAWVVRDRSGRASERLVVDRAMLRRATRTLRELTGDYGVVLGHVVETPGPWAQGVGAVLEALKPAVHRGEALLEPGEALAGAYPVRVLRRARELGAGGGLAGEVVRALLWSFATIPAQLSPALDALASLHAALARDDASGPARLTLDDAFGHVDGRERLALALDLVALVAREHLGGLQPLFDVLRNEEAYAVPTSPGASTSGLHLHLKSKNYREPTSRRLVMPPEPSLGPALSAWVGWLAAQAGPTCRRALHLLARLDAPASLATWAAWWGQLDRVDRKARRALALVDKAEREQQAELAYRELCRLDKCTPLTLPGSALTDLVSWYAGEADPTFYAAALRALEALGPTPLALAFLAHWRELYRVDSASARGAVDGFRRYLELSATLGPQRLRPWPAQREAASRRWRSSALHRECELVDERNSPRTIARFYEALAACSLAREGVVSDTTLQWLVALANVDAPPSAITEVALRADLDEFMGVASADLVRSAFEAARCDTQLALALLKRFAALDAPDQGTYVLRPLRPLLDAGRHELALALLDDAALLPKLAACGRNLERLKLDVVCRVPSADDVPAWAGRYPPELRGVLAELASVDDDAEQGAERLLRSSFPRDEGLRAQIAAAKTRLETLAGPARGRLARRIENLEARLGGANRAGPGRVARCRVRVERAIRTAIVGRLCRLVSGAAERLLRELLAPDEPPAWLFEPTLVPLLAPIPGLDPEGRALAVRVLRARLGPPPWDMRDEPANRAFLRRLARKGIATAPWVEGVGPVRYDAADGRPLTLWLEDDPLRVLEMGAPFKTCLSPGSFNYFSAFANAADVNKRVLYAADATGTIAGRCLLALTDEGGLVAFHPYAHSRKLGFDALVKRFASSLAAAMGTELLPRGRVSRLVAHDWYDDGPVDLGGRFDFLQEGSAFRRSLASIDPKAFVSALAEQFQPLTLNELSLSLTFELAELYQRPELAEPLFPLTRCLEALPAGAILNVARLALALGKPNLVNRRLVAQLEANVLADQLDRGELDVASVGVLLDLDPARALDVLRPTRQKGLRSWEGCEAERLALAAKANERLFRPRQAITLYEAAARAHTNPEARAQCIERARALA